ncbi:MAG: sporulation protein YunB [Clostridia bacterium]
MKRDKIYSRFRICLPNKLSENKTSKNKKSYNKLISCICIIIVAIITFYAITKTINPIINQLCIDKAKNIATNISNEEATLIMSKYSYEDIVTIVRDNDGNVIMLQTNTKNINTIISDIPVNILKRFEEEENCNISIYLGNILGTKYFSARGPKINIKIANVGNVETKLESEFQAQGINQTLHRIYLSLICEVTILTPYDTIKQNIENQVLLAESVIVGNVPNSYYNIEGDNSKSNSIRLIE